MTFPHILQSHVFFEFFNFEPKEILGPTIWGFGLGQWGLCAVLSGALRAVHNFFYYAIIETHILWYLGPSFLLDTAYIEGQQFFTLFPLFLPHFQIVIDVVVYIFAPSLSFWSGKECETLWHPKLRQLNVH